MRMALEGAGIAVVNDHFALPYLQRGELVQVLPDWRSPSGQRVGGVPRPAADAGANAGVPRRARRQVHRTASVRRSRPK